MSRGPLVAAAALVAIGGAIALVASGTDSVRTSDSPAVHARSGRGAAIAAQPRARLDDLAGRPGAAGALDAEWQATTDRAARLAILDAAGKIPDPTGLELLVRVATTDDSLAAHAAAAIGRMRNPKVADALAGLAASDEHVIVRANAARALAASGGTQHAPVLSALVADPGAPMRVRQEAALSLARVGDDVAVGRLVETLDTLRADPSEQAAQLRISIVQALGGIGSPAARDALAAENARELTATERAFIARALEPRRGR